MSKQESTSQVIFLQETPGSLNSVSLSHLEKIRIDSKLVSSEKASQVLNVAKDGFGIWSRREVIHDDLLGMREG